MKRLISDLRASLPFIGEKYTTKCLMLRRRGDKFVIELLDSVRYRYDDRPNAYKLETGEEIPSVSLENVYTMDDGTPFFMVQELEDEQYSPVNLSFDGEEINASIIRDKDQILGFYLDHLKESYNKYASGGILREHANIILIAITGLAIAFIMYSVGDFQELLRLGSDFLSELSNIGERLENIENLLEEGEGVDGGPPGE